MRKFKSETETDNPTNDMSKSDEQLFEEFKAFKKRKEEAESQEQPPKRKATIRMRGIDDYEEYQKNGAGPKALKQYLKKNKQAEIRIRNNGGSNYVPKPNHQ